MSKLADACNVDNEKWNGLSNSQPGCIELAYYKVVHIRMYNYMDIVINNIALILA